jgi:putative FmdB family regulatory protein
VPIYEYACESCRARFEVQQKMSDPPVATCAKCGAPVKKVISAPAIMFKGSGWYVTDYSDKLKPPAGSDAEAKPKAESSLASESKPDGKPVGTTSGTGTGETPAAGSSTSSSSSTPASGSSGGSGSSSTG